MTSLMDRFFIAIGFDADEIAASSTRAALYWGIVIMASLACVFVGLSL